MNPYAILGGVAIWAASLAAVGNWQNQAGHTAERSAWQTREAIQLRDANTEIQQLQEDARATERAHGLALAAISADYQGKLDASKHQRAADAAALAAGTLRLRDPAATSRCADSRAPGPTPASPGGRDAAPAGELSAAAAGFLLDLANDADDTARQLTACQAVVRQDRQGAP